MSLALRRVRTAKKRSLTWLDALREIPMTAVPPLHGQMSAIAQVGGARAVTFSASTRNSLVVLPRALAMLEELRALAAAAVITQPLVELVAELADVRAVPAILCRDRSAATGSPGH